MPAFARSGKAVTQRVSLAFSSFALFRSSRPSPRRRLGHASKFGSFRRPRAIRNEPFHSSTFPLSCFPYLFLSSVVPFPQQCRILYRSFAEWMRSLAISPCQRSRRKPASKKDFGPSNTARKSALPVHFRIFCSIRTCLDRLASSAQDARTNDRLSFICVSGLYRDCGMVGDLSFLWVSTLFYFKQKTSRVLALAFPTTCQPLLAHWQRSRSQLRSTWRTHRRRDLFISCRCARRPF